MSALVELNLNGIWRRQLRISISVASSSFLPFLLVCPVSFDASNDTSVLQITGFSLLLTWLPVSLEPLEADKIIIATFPCELLRRNQTDCTLNESLRQKNLTMWSLCLSVRVVKLPKFEQISYVITDLSKSEVGFEDCAFRLSIVKCSLKVTSEYKSTRKFNYIKTDLTLHYYLPELLYKRELISD